MTQRNPSKITTSYEVDDPLVQDANFEFDADDRQYIDNQIRGCQQRIVELHDDGVGGITLLTTDDVETRAKRYAVADGEVKSLRAIITVQSADGSGGVRGEWEIKACYGRVAGTLAAEYVAFITELFAVGAPGAPTLTLNGDTDVDLNVTGIAATGLTWKVSEFSL